MEKTDFLRAITEKPIKCESLPGKGGEHGIIEGQDAGHHKWREQKKKIETDVAAEAPSVQA